MRKIPKKTFKFTEIIKKHIKDNIKSYILVSLIMLIGIVLGVIFVNNMGVTQTQEVQSYLHEFVNNLKESKNINNTELLNKSLKSNAILVFTMWFIGSTVVGIPLVVSIVGFRGFCIGYTVSSAIKTFGTAKGIVFFLTSMMLQNLIFIPSIIALAVSGIKLYKSITKDKRKENIKLEIIRHTVLSFIILIVLIISSIIETYLSTNLLLLSISYF